MMMEVSLLWIIVSVHMHINQLYCAKNLNFYYYITQPIIREKTTIGILQVNFKLCHTTLLVLLFTWFMLGSSYLT